MALLKYELQRSQNRAVLKQGFPALYVRHLEDTTGHVRSKKQGKSCLTPRCGLFSLLIYQLRRA